MFQITSSDTELEQQQQVLEAYLVKINRIYDKSDQSSGLLWWNDYISGQGKSNWCHVPGLL